MSAQPEENETPDPAQTPEPSVEETLRQKIAEMEAQLATARDQALRALAEAENTRKRAQREMEDTSRYAVSNFASDIVGAIENLQRASSSITAEQRAQDELLSKLGDGVDMVMRELLGTLERYGIARIDPLGEKFDHKFHQAVAQVESADAEPGTITQVMQAGYLIHDRLLRPAMVSVAKAPAKKDD